MKYNNSLNFRPSYCCHKNVVYLDYFECIILIHMHILINKVSLLTGLHGNERKFTKT